MGITAQKVQGTLIHSHAPLGPIGTAPWGTEGRCVSRALQGFTVPVKPLRSPLSALE